LIISYDKDGNLTVGRVKRTMVNTVKYVLDMFGTGVMPAMFTFTAMENLTI